MIPKLKHSQLKTMSRLLCSTFDFLLFLPPDPSSAPLPFLPPSTPPAPVPVAAPAATSPEALAPPASPAPTSAEADADAEADSALDPGPRLSCSRFCCRFGFGIGRLRLVGMRVGERSGDGIVYLAVLAYSVDRPLMFSPP